MKLFYRFFISVIILFGCKQSTEISIKQEGLTVVKKENFIITTNNLKLLSSNNCSEEIIIDSMKSISEYIKKILKSSKNSQRSKYYYCIKFTLTNNIDSTEKNEIKIEKIPKRKSWSAGVTPNNKLLIVTIKDSLFIRNLMGYINNFKPINSNQLNEYVEQLYLSELDSDGKNQKVVQLIFEKEINNDIHLYFSQMVIGYIKAMRKICYKKYNKDLKSATNFEIKELKNLNPLYFSLTTDSILFNKNNIKTIKTPK